MGNSPLGAQPSNVPLSGGAIENGSLTLAELAQSLRNYLVPIGAILPYGGVGTAPSGFVYCDGALHDTSGTCTTCGLAHSTLATVLSNAYGGTLGSTFRVPDLRGRVPMGVGTGTGGGASGSTGSNPSGGVALSNRARGDWAGAQTHLLSGAESGIQSHSTNSSGSHSHTIDNGGSHSHSASTNSTGGHVHGYTASYDQNWNIGGGGSVSLNKGTFGANTSEAGSHSHTVTVNSGGSHDHGMQPAGSHSHSVDSASATSAHNNLQPFVVVNYIIKAI